MIKKVQILRTQGCASCAQATVLVNKIKQEETLTFQIEEIDITEHPELLQKYQIMTSPGIVIDGELAFTGMPNTRKLRERLVQ